MYAQCRPRVLLKGTDQFCKSKVGENDDELRYLNNGILMTDKTLTIAVEADLIFVFEC